MVETARIFIAFGLTLLLVMLRLEAERFGAAEYDELVGGRPPSRMRRLGWYLVGVVGVVAVYVVYPAPARDLYLVGGGQGVGGVALGLLLGGIGAGLAVGLAWWRYRHLRLPSIGAYPGALVNEIGTAVLDEAVFRGALLGFLVLGGFEPRLAILTQAIAYVLATRLGAPGRSRPMFFLACAVGLVAGWATVLTGGIAASILGHGVTRVAVFLTTGHAGQPAPRGAEVEEVERSRRAPEGWRVVAGEGTRRDGSRGR